MTFVLTDLPPWFPKGKREEPLLILVQTTSIPASAVDHLEPLPNELIPHTGEVSLTREQIKKMSEVMSALTKSEKEAQEMSGSVKELAEELKQLRISRAR